MATHPLSPNPAALRLRSPGGWPLAAMAVAGLISVPILVVFASLALPASPAWQHLADTVLGRYVANSVWLAVAVGSGTLVLGTAAAWFVTMCQFPGRRLFEWALVTPMALPAYVIAYTYTSLLDVAGPIQVAIRATFRLAVADYWFPEIRSLPGAAVMMTLVFYPYVYLLARAAFVEQSVCVLEASRTLGCGPWKSFFAVALPLARPAIAIGVALALMEALNDFGTVQYFGVDTLTTGIFRTWFGMGEPQVAAQLAAILAFAVFVLIGLERWSRLERRTFHATTRYRPLPRLALRGSKAGAVSALCAALVGLGFVLPVAALVAGAAIGARRMVDARFLTEAANSVVLALIAAVVCAALGLVVAYGRRLWPRAVTGIAAQIASSGYAFPGAVIAVGILVPFAWIDQRIDGMARDLFGVGTGLILSGTIVAVTFSYVVRFMAVAHGSLESGLARITPSMDGAARTLGCNVGQTLARIHAPLMRGSVLTAMLLVFVETVKELPATIIMRPFDFDTLAIRVYQLAVDERLADAGPPALAIVLAGLIPVVLLSRAVGLARPGATGGGALGD
ncbi:MAG: iron ABC transporter permease [Alphaproteobacteria bacterium]|nr:iron ABC transporter permease [Alphaproteobacteria bacterium]